MYFYGDSYYTVINFGFALYSKEKEPILFLRDEKAREKARVCVYVVNIK